MAVRGLAALKKFEAGARSERINAQPVRPSVPESPSPAQQISRTFKFQSYFDSTLFEKAILPQLTNDPIVASTVKEEQVAGYAIGLHPSSQTPVAVQFKIGGQPTSSQALTLKPGQIVRPHGLPPGMKQGSFSGFSWGLPFGWLGGGVATIVVFQTPDSDVLWPGNPEVIFHRQRMLVRDSAALPIDPFPFNWPMRFPWINAIQGTNNLNQRGQPAIAIDPTRVLMRLRTTALNNAQTMRVIYKNTNDFDLDADGLPTDEETGYDMTWGTWTAFDSEFQVQEVPGAIGFRPSADFGGVILVSNNLEMIGLEVDVVRYGRLG